MDVFYSELTAQLSVLEEHFTQNKKCVSRILDAKECMLNDDPVNTNDTALINRLLDDLLKINCILADNKESFDKFREMYTP